MHVQRAGDQTPGAHGASVLESYSGRLAALDHDAVELDLRREPPAHAHARCASCLPQSR
jgi:hypothetical protein